MTTRHLILILLISMSGTVWGQVQEAVYSIHPETFGENDTIRIEVSGIEPGQWGVDEVYLWAWSYDENDENPMDAPGNGTWTNSSESHKLEDLGNGIYGITLVPSVFFDRQGIGRIGMLVKAKNGTGDKKTPDYFTEVGRFQMQLLQPNTPLHIQDSASQFTIRATTSQEATFSLLANGDTVFHSDQPDTLFVYDYDLQKNTRFQLLAHRDGDTLVQSFTVVVTPEHTYASAPSNLMDGVNFHGMERDSVTFVLFAPGKEWVHLIGNFNEWEINDTYLMNRDTTQDRFWITLTDLEPQENILYQYLVEFQINIADPYSTSILDPYHDQFLDSAIWPDLPEYPHEKTTEAVTWISHSTSEYQWQNEGLVPPSREKLVIYEILIRDFDERHSFEAVRERLDYLQDLGVNAIELMPVSEFDGNESWGYNPSFHMALDKYYGSPHALKQLIDECHARGMAVILDVVYNHATGQNPYVRLWNDCNGCLAGNPREDNPFFNEEAKHAYSVFHDFNHQSEATQEYVKRTIEYWINEYRIDGFRWDLTKGFTQNCGGGNQDACTNAYQTDRVEVLKSYADIQWNANPEFLVIFEHLGVGTSRTEEMEWAGYRIDEGLGILLWNNLNYQYSEAVMGYHDGSKSNFSQVYGPNRELPVSSAISYMESHDEERLMYKMLEYGNGSGDYQIQSNLTALNRLKLAAAFFLPIPGPKMIWQFGELGYPYSINYNGRTGNKPIHPEYADDPERAKVYKTFQALSRLRNAHQAFTSAESEVTSDVAGEVKRVTIEHPGLDVVIIGNFGVTGQSGQSRFSHDGKWYEYFSGDSITVVNIDTIISLDPGEFRLFTSHRFEPPAGDILTHATQLQAELHPVRTPTLYPNSPNPFDQQTRITYDLPRSAHVSIEVFDVTGQRIVSLQDGWQTAGTHHLDFSKSQLQPGIYFYRLKTKDFTTVRKMVCH